MGVHQALAYTSLGTDTALLKSYIPIKIRRLQMQSPDFWSECFYKIS